MTKVWTYQVVYKVQWPKSCTYIKVFIYHEYHMKFKEVFICDSWWKVTWHDIKGFLVPLSTHPKFPRFPSFLYKNQVWDSKERECTRCQYWYKVTRCYQSDSILYTIYIRWSLSQCYKVSFIDSFWFIKL